MNVWCYLRETNFLRNACKVKVLLVFSFEIIFILSLKPAYYFFISVLALFFLLSISFVLIFLYPPLVWNQPLIISTGVHKCFLLLTLHVICSIATLKNWHFFYTFHHYWHFQYICIKMFSKSQFKTKYKNILPKSSQIWHSSRKIYHNRLEHLLIPLYIFLTKTEIF